MAALLAVCAVAIGYLVRFNQAQDSSAALGKYTMRAVHHAEYGAVSDVLRMSDVPVPTYRSWEVVVEVNAASINPADYKIVEGAFFLIDFLLPHRPGFDFSGIVRAVGKDCTRIRVGDNVHGMAWVHKTGTLAEYLAVDESAVNAVPRGMSSQEAAAMPLVAHTSFSALVTIGGLRRGENQRVLVLGGSSATGMMALQISKAYGAASVVTTCSPRNEALVKSLGADETLNYREHDVFERMRAAERSFDIIYDTVGAGLSVWQGAASGVLAPGGQLVTITGDVQRTLDLQDLLTRGYQIVTRKLYCLLALGGAGYHQYTQPGGNSAELAVLDKLVEEGALKAVVDRSYEFSLEQILSAFAYLQAGHASGKLVVDVRR